MAAQAVAPTDCLPALDTESPAPDRPDHFDSEHLELRLEGDALVIEGIMAPFAPGTLEPVYAEVKLSRYRRSFTLSRELDGSRTAATLKDGVLTLQIPKQADAKPRRIELTVT